MTDDDTKPLIDRHLRLGWWCVAAFALLGLVLEGLHAFKSGAYLDVGQETRRHMLTLAHSHGTLLGLVNLGFAWTLTRIGAPSSWASRCLIAASFALPVGFGLGGLFAHDGDPGIGIVLVPAGALCLVAAALLTARAASARP